MAARAPIFGAPKLVTYRIVFKIISNPGRPAEDGSLTGGSIHRIRWAPDSGSNLGSLAYWVL